jgi:hypothetical protein
MTIESYSELKNKLLADFSAYSDRILKEIDQKIYWYDKLKKWELTGYSSYASPVSRFGVDAPTWSFEVYINIFVRKDYPFIKAVHLIIDELIDYMGIEPEELRKSEYPTSISFMYKDLVEIRILASGACHAIYKKVTKDVNVIVGYECG